jgi:hypothetical protein
MERGAVPHWLHACCLRMLVGQGKHGYCGSLAAAVQDTMATTSSSSCAGA